MTGLEAAKYKSLHENEDFLFCEIDGMDSTKTLLPHFSRKDKSIQKERLLKLHLTCVKFNGTRPDEMYYFTDAFPHDSANTITVMYMTLLKVTAYSISQSPPSDPQPVLSAGIGAGRDIFNMPFNVPPWRFSIPRTGFTKIVFFPVPTGS